MKYLLLIYASEAALAQPENQARMPALVEGHEAMQAELRAQAVDWAAARLDRAPTARTLVQAAEGHVTHDGPFAETKEQLAGFYLVDAPDMAAAEAWAAKIPQIPGGKVEVRAVVHSPD